MRSYSAHFFAYSSCRRTWSAYTSVKVFPLRCALLAIATVGLRLIIPCINMSVEPLAGVEGAEVPGAGTGNSPWLTFSSTRSSSSMRPSAASVRNRSRSTCSRRADSRRSARSLTAAHSCSTFSTIALDCASRASTISISRRKPATSLA